MNFSGGNITTCEYGKNECEDCEKHEEFWDDYTDDESYFDGCLCNYINDQYHLTKLICPYFKKKDYDS